MRSHFEHLDDGEYQAAFDLFAPSYQAKAGSGWVSQRSAAHPRVSIAFIEPSSNNGSFATFSAKIYLRDTVNVDGSDTQCRRFQGTLAARKLNGRWYYSPADNDWSPAVLPSSTSECP